MSVKVHTSNEQDGRISFHNGFGWFLDSVFGGQELPARFFSQAIGPTAGHPDPGPLTAEQAAQFADDLDALSDETLEQRMWQAVNGRPADPDMRPAIAAVRDLSDLARAGAQRDGLYIL